VQEEQEEAQAAPVKPGVPWRQPQEAHQRSLVNQEEHLRRDPREEEVPVATLAQ